MSGAVVVWLFLIIASIAFYFLPFIIAERRKHKNKLAILITNLLLGWTVVGWIGALIWSTTDNTTPAALST
jgi:RsiW-degrading membrane proteinase PrsW (M82 family)